MHLISLIPASYRTRSPRLTVPASVAKERGPKTNRGQSMCSGRGSDCQFAGRPRVERANLLAGDGVVDGGLDVGVGRRAFDERGDLALGIDDDH